MRRIRRVTQRHLDGRGGALFLAGGMAGATLTLGAGWLYHSDRLLLSLAAPTGTHVVIWEELALYLLTIALSGALACALLRRGRRELKAKEAEIAQVSWRLNLALDASGVGFWDVDLATDALAWDDRARAIFGMPPRDGFFSEEDWAGAVHPADRERAVEAANVAVAAGERFVSDYRVLLPDGQVRYVRDMAASYVAPDGSRRLSGLVWDVTADKQREEELELRRREAESANTAKSNFLAAMSHEIRTPLTGVIGMLDLMLDDDLPPQQAERARVASTSAQTLLQMLNEVLDFSKIEAAAIALNPASVRPRELICEVTDLMRARASQKGLELHCSVSDCVPEWISIDPVRLRQVLANIVSNAISFTEAGYVSVRTDYSPASSGGTLAISVEDSGVGIPQADRERIFERFVQADGSPSRRAGGTGLGLAIARQLVELMGGSIAVESVEGCGSTFRFTVHAGPAEAQPAAAPEPASAPPPMRVLVAEDNPTNQYLVKALLAAGGHLVTVVPDGPSAVHAVRDGDFDVVLMDVQMPGMDGTAAARAIRGLPGRCSDIFIIALTASVLTDDPERFTAAGMNDYVAKPIDRAVLARALARAAVARESELAPRAG